jgi:hypothetical protein
MVALAVVVGWLGPLVAQEPSFELALRDGSVVIGSELRGDADRGFVVRTARGPRPLPLASLLSIAGVPAAVPALPTVHLQGGAMLCGAIVGGDAGGNRLDVLSPVLGRQTVPVDRLVAVGAAGVQAPLSLRVPDGIDEALLVRAAIGFDVIAGTLHQFGDRGLRFQPDGGEARWYAANEFTALRLRGAIAPEAPSSLLLVTRLGERLAVANPRALAEGLVVQLEGGVDATVRWPDLAALVWLGAAVFAADLEPTEVVESGRDGEVVMPWQRDRSVLGAPLVSGGHTHGKGLGVHAQSRLVFRVPAGCAQFWTRVGFDDSASSLPLLPHAAVRIVIDGKVVFQEKALRAGPAPLDPGPLAVVPGGTVALEVECGAGLDLGDRVDWLSPVFLPAGARKP